MKSKIKAILKRILTRLRVLKEERREMLSLRRYQLAVKNRLASNPGRVFLVGCGTMGGHIAAAVRDLEGWTIPAVYDNRPEMPARIQQKWFPEASGTQSLDELLSNVSKQDILAIASTADSHVEIATRAIDRGIHKIFLEKPIATSLDEARRLCQYVEAHNTCLYIDHVRRWVPPLIGVKRMLKNGVIGEVHSLHYNFGRAGLAMIGTHLFDLSRFLFDAEILKVRATLDPALRTNWRGAHFKDYSGRAEMEMDNGILISLDLSDRMPLQQDCFVIYGAQGRIEVDQRLERISLIAGSGNVWQEDYPWSGTVPVALSHALLELNQGKTPRCSAYDGLKALEATLACYASHRNENSWTTIPLNGEIVNEVFPFA